MIMRMSTSTLRILAAVIAVIGLSLGSSTDLRGWLSLFVVAEIIGGLPTAALVPAPARVSRRL
jgi:hypothetical protein